jgi:hypothetical protein
MPIDPTIEPWLEKWEARQHDNPALTPDEFLASISTELPHALLDCLRQAIADLRWVTDFMARMKRLGCDR